MQILLGGGWNLACPDGFQSHAKIIRIVNTKDKSLICFGMSDLERIRVQCRAPDQVRWWGAVKRIPQERVAEREGVDADLVGPPGRRVGFDQTIAFVPFQDPKKGFRGFPPVGIHHGPVSVTHIDSEWMPGRMLLPGRHPRDDGMINLARLAMLELDIQESVSFGRTSKEHHPAGHLVQAMDHPQLPRLLLQLLKQVRSILFPAIRQDG